MTDPRNDPAGAPGQQGGDNPPSSGSSRQQQTRHGLFHRGSQGRTTGSADTSNSAGSTATATRETTQASTSTSVPQQAGQPAASRSQYGQGQYAGDQYAGDQYDQDYRAGTGGNVVAKAAQFSWEIIMLCALGMIAIGICLLVWPSASLFVVAILIGAALVVSGIVKLWEGFTAHDRSGGIRAGYVVVGLLAVLAGIYCLRHHALSVFLIAFVAGVYFVAHGIADLGVSFQPGVPGRGLRAVMGIFSIGAGLVLVIWPGLSLTLLLLIAGAWLLLYGCVLAGLALSVRKAAKEMARPSMRTTTAAAAGTA
jgi:uncharacterized membrane protein HdeD (DUF308 family)